jgi:hypothetical protein
MHLLEKLKKHAVADKETYRPQFFRLSDVEERVRLEELLKSENGIVVQDEIAGQLYELVKLRNPTVKITDAIAQELIRQHLNGTEKVLYGVWVYYPWSKCLVHLLEEDEFVEVRTNRNKYKITSKEQQLLSKKTIGVIGLSVGHSIVTTIALERVCGELRIADLDTLELSNLNRINASLSQLGFPKTVIAARAVSEIDPYIKVSVFDKGINTSNVDDFMNAEGKLDLLIEECDSFDIKILARIRAKNYGIPVLMDTNDRGLIDVERYDLEPTLPILHGLLSDADIEIIKNAKSNEERIPYVLKVVDSKNASIKGKASLIEVGQTLSSWPQLASAVVGGAGATVNIARRILLNEFTQSGRFYFEIEDVMPSDDYQQKVSVASKNTHFEVEVDEGEILWTESSLVPTLGQIDQIIVAANLAPSVGNDQPWRWQYHGDRNILILSHDEKRAFSFGNYKNVGSYVSLGACFENAYTKALSMGIELHFQSIKKTDSSLAYSISFHQYYSTKEGDWRPLDLEESILSRETNRLITNREPIEELAIQKLKEACESVSRIKLHMVSSLEKITELGEIVGRCDRMRFLHEESHRDFFEREMRWDIKSVLETKDGIGFDTLGLSKAQEAAIDIVRDYSVVDFLNKENLGSAFTKISIKQAESASAMILITIPDFKKDDLFRAGIAMERFWLLATSLNISVHPLISPVFFFTRLVQGGAEGIEPKHVPELNMLKEKFHQVFDGVDGQTGVFLCRIFRSTKEGYPKYRRGVDEVLEVI